MKLATNSHTRSKMIAADRLMFGLLCGLALYSMALAPVYQTWTAAITVSLLCIGAVSSIRILLPGKRMVRVAMGLSFMIMTALHVHQLHGMIEAHFGFFMLLAILLYYKDWLAIVASAGLVAVHHLTFYWWQSGGGNLFLFADANAGWMIVFMHAAYVVVETAILVVLARTLYSQELSAAYIQEATLHITESTNIDLSYRCPQGQSELTDAFNRFLSTLETAIGSAAAEGGQLLETQVELRGSFSALDGKTRQQFELTERIVSEIQRMTGTMAAVALNTSEASSISGAAQDIADQSGTLVSGSQQKLRDLNTTIGDTLTMVTKLDESARSIGSVIDVIKKIADQTNLLALNAAIEAARAGEQGRGFAVVADEVRSLASQTQVSTGEIERMIKTLQEGSQRAVAGMSSSQESVNEFNESMNVTNDTFSRISANIHSLENLSQEIAQATKQQNSSAEDISSSATDVRSHAVEGLEALERLAPTVVRVQEIADRLKASMQNFSYSNRA